MEKFSSSIFEWNFLHHFSGAMDYQTILTHMASFRDCGHRLLHLVHFSDHQSVACCTTQLVSAKQWYLSLCYISLLLQSFSLHSFWRKNRIRTKNWMHQSHCYEITSDYFARNRKSIFTSWVIVKSREKNTENFDHCFVVPTQEIRKCSIVGSVAHMFIVRCNGIQRYES